MSSPVPASTPILMLRFRFAGGATPSATRLLSFAKQALAFFVKSGRRGPFFFVHWFWQSACSILFRSTRISSAVGNPQAMYLGFLEMKPWICFFASSAASMLHVVLLDVSLRKVGEDLVFRRVHELERFGNELEQQGECVLLVPNACPSSCMRWKTSEIHFRGHRAVVAPLLITLTVIVVATAFDCAARSRARSRRWSRSSCWRGGDPIVDAPQQSEAQSQPNVVGPLGDAPPHHPLDVALGKIAQGPPLVLSEPHGV